MGGGQNNDESLHLGLGREKGDISYMMQGEREKEARRVQFDQKNERGDFIKYGRS